MIKDYSKVPCTQTVTNNTNDILRINNISIQPKEKMSLYIKQSDELAKFKSQVSALNLLQESNTSEGIITVGTRYKMTLNTIVSDEYMNLTTYEDCVKWSLGKGLIAISEDMQADDTAYIEVGPQIYLQFQDSIYWCVNKYMQAYIKETQNIDIPLGWVIEGEDFTLTPAQPPKNLEGMVTYLGTWIESEENNVQDEIKYSLEKFDGLISSITQLSNLNPYKFTVNFEVKNNPYEEIYIDSACVYAVKSLDNIEDQINSSIPLDFIQGDNIKQLTFEVGNDYPDDAIGVYIQLEGHYGIGYDFINGEVPLIEHDDKRYAVIDYRTASGNEYTLYGYLPQ